MQLSAVHGCGCLATAQALSNYIRSSSTSISIRSSSTRSEHFEHPRQLHNECCGSKLDDVPVRIVDNHCLFCGVRLGFRAAQFIAGDAAPSYGMGGGVEQRGAADHQNLPSGYVSWAVQGQADEAPQVDR